MMLYKNKYESRLIYSIHDEWIIEISDNDPKDLPKIIQNEINKVWKKYFKVPLPCELSITETNWYDKVEVKNCTTK